MKHDQTMAGGAVFAVRNAGKLIIFASFCILVQLAAAGNVSAGVDIRDIICLSQDPLSYVDDKTADRPLLPPEKQKRLNSEANMVFFAPWHREKPWHRKELASWGLQKYKNNPGYGNPNVSTDKDMGQMPGKNTTNKLNAGALSRSACQC